MQRGLTEDTFAKVSKLQAKLLEKLEAPKVSRRSAPSPSQSSTSTQHLDEPGAPAADHPCSRLRIVVDKSRSVYIVPDNTGASICAGLAVLGFSFCSAITRKQTIAVISFWRRPLRKYHCVACKLSLQTAQRSIMLTHDSWFHQMRKNSMGKCNMQGC